MRWESIIDTTEIKRTIETLKPKHQLFEIRILGTDKKRILSGYFTDAETLINAFDSVDLRGANVYFTLNEVEQSLYSRVQHDKFVANTSTTSDSEILTFQWLFVDLDPIRPAGISSSDEELEEARKAAAKVKEYLQDLKFEEPIEAMSGNGYHLLYRINLPNDSEKENTQLIAYCLATLAALFNNDTVKIDVVNCNPSRICKLHGTMAQKGANTDKRPHRMSKLLSVPESLKITHKRQLLRLVEELPEEIRRPVQQTKTNTSSEFDVVEFMNAHGLTYTEHSGTQGRIFHLDHCPFDHNHINGDARIFAYPNGAVAFKCHHNSCKQYKWQDVRLKYEPDAYEPKSEDDGHIDEGWKQHKLLKAKDEEPEKKVEIDIVDGQTVRTYTRSGINGTKVKEVITDHDLDMPSLSSIEKKTKDWLVPGYIPRGCITLLCSDGGIGKTTIWCDTVAALTQGKATIFDRALSNPFSGRKPAQVMYFSKEDPTAEVLIWKMEKANADFKNIRCFALDDDRINKIQYGCELLEKLIEKFKPELVVFDTLQAFLPNGVEMSKRKDMREALQPLNALGAKFGTSFLLIMHTNKSSNSGRQRMADSSDIWDLGRSAMMAGRTKDGNVCYLSHEKSNYGALQKTILFEVVDDAIQFKGTSSKKDRDYIQESQLVFTTPKKEEAKDFIMEQLKNADEGKIEINEIIKIGKAAGISKNALENAKSDLLTDNKITRKCMGFGAEKKWYLILPMENTQE